MAPSAALGALGALGLLVAALGPVACTLPSEKPSCPGASGCPADGGGAGGGDAGGADRDGAGASAADARPARDTSNIAPGLVAAYNFDEGNGSVVIDSSGNENNGGFVGTMGWAQGRVGGDATFGGGYVVLPPHLLDQARELTLAAWVRVRNNVATWQRIFDFGHGTSGYFFLTTRTTSDTLRFAITRLGWTNEEILEVPTPLSGGTWKHVAVVLNSAGGTMYVDGSPVASNPAVTLRPMDVGPFPDAWLGKSHFVTTDPPLDGELDQVRIYSRGLSAAEIANLAGTP